MSIKKSLIICLLFPFFVIGQQYLTYNHNGINRDYIFYQPSGLSSGAPLVFVTHGYSSSAQNIMNYSGFNLLALQNQFAVCYPQGTQDNSGNNFWNVGYLFTAGSNIDDVDFLVSLAQELQNTFNLSSENTFLTGMSNGAELSYLVACESPGTFKAYAPVAGTIFTNGLPNNSCNGVPTPIFEIHGENDNVTLFDGNLNDQFWGPYLSIDSVVNYWVNNSNLNNLLIDTLANTNNNNKYTISYKYSSLSSDNEVWLYKHKDGHSWDVDDLITQNEIWNFFTKYITVNNTNIDEYLEDRKRKLIKIVNILGQEVKERKNEVLLYFYDDGYVKKTILLE
jgi:polyhydroxybutyrate depolymerase